MREGFIFYESFRSAMKYLPAETQLRLYNAITDYALYNIEPDFGDDDTARGFFTLMRPQIDANIRKREAGARGGRPPRLFEGETFETQREADEVSNENHKVTKVKPSGNQTVTNPEPKEKEKAKEKFNDNVKAKGNAKAIVAEQPRCFSKPSIEDIRKYCRERKNDVAPQRFFDFYESKGWFVGNQPMKDWQAAVRRWESGDSERPRDHTRLFAKSGGKPQIEQNAHTDKDLEHLLVDLDVDFIDREQLQLKDKLST